MTSQRQPRRRRPAKAKRRSSQDTNGREGRTVAEGSRQEGASRSATSSTKAAGTEINNGGFSTLGLSSTTLKAVNQAGYSQPTPVQSGVIPRAIAGIDVLGQAQTGTGKTASFVLPILELLTRSSGRGHGVRALVLVPTRELAVQVRDEFEKLAAGSKLRCVAVYGGKPIKSQIDKLARNPQVVVGTPGRVLDHMSRGTLVLSDLELVTLDEADRMLD
ncbi:MAG: DEAD/DEAH box helicase, partial [Planctomycetota bacterium]|nr:DEAD/DEAH box helicase [Planctomycetota bacterium]